METIAIIEKWLFILVDKAVYVYFAFYFMQRWRDTPISVKEAWLLNLLDDFTYKVLLPVLSLLGFFQLTDWGTCNMLDISFDMMLIMGMMYFVRRAAVSTYFHVKGEFVELVVVAKSNNEATYILQTLDERVFWQETTKEIPLLKLFNSAEENCYLVKIRDVILTEENPFVIEFLTEDEVKDEVERIKKQRGSE